MVAVRNVDFGEGGDAGSAMFQTIGFDLDGKCTGQGEGPSCRAPSWADQFPDGVDGRDNAVGTLYVADDAGVPSQRAASLNLQTELGLGTMIFWVQNYNGTDRDADVEVALYAATMSPDVLQTKPNEPHWDGTDAWQVFVEWTIPVVESDGGRVASPFEAQYRSTRAYVSDGILVAYFESARGLPAYEFTGVWLQARIDDGVRGDGQWSLKDGIFAGRLNIDSALAVTEFAPDPATGAMMTCTRSPSYSELKRRVCRLADISASVDDGSAPCDAASWAWKFDAQPALIAPDVNPATVADIRKCPPAQSPDNDECKSLDASPP